MDKITYLETKKPGKTYVFPEEKLNQWMETEAEPYLKSIMVNGYFPKEKGLYYELYPLKEAAGTIVISFGFTESCAKYHELIYYFLKEGYQVAIADHRGHGKSPREVEEVCVVHIERFTQYVEDLHSFLHSVVLPWAGDAPCYLYGHSMGGCIGARYLECYPGDFKKAVLNAPMLGIEMGGCPIFVAALICDINILLGRGRKKLFTHREYNQEDPFSRSNADSEMRHNYYRSLRCKDASYQTSAASYLWGREAIRAGRKTIRKRETKKISVPVLLFQAGGDSVVSSKPQIRFVERTESAKMVIVPEVRHEIYRSRNPVLQNYLDAVYSWFS